MSNTTCSNEGRLIKVGDESNVAPCKIDKREQIVLLAQSWVGAAQRHKYSAPVSLSTDELQQLDAE